MAFKMTVIVYIAMAVVLLASEGGDAIIGINWGRTSAQRLVPSQVVDLLLQNGVRHARVYSTDLDILEAFSGSGINLTVTVKDALQFTSMDDARMWVQTKSPYFGPCNIRNIYFGSYVFAMGYGNRTYIQYALNSLRYLQNALNELGHNDIKATFLNFVPITNNGSKPSECDFNDVIKGDMVTALRLLQQSNAPFVYEMLPIGEIGFHMFDPTYAYPDNKSPLVIKDINGAVYRNQFEFSHDCIAWALAKHNASDIKIIIGMVGWPTDGLDGASAENSERYYKYLLPLVASNKGTPMRPGEPIDTYVHSLTDENRQDADFTRHWGIYRSNGEPKFKIDLSGQGRDIYPTTIKGIMRMPDRWCVYNKDRTNPDKVNAQFKIACDKSDCTSISPSGSCGMLNYEQRVSYAFNTYFQFNFQDEASCDFDGLAYVTVEDPSVKECMYPVEVVKGQQINFVEAVNGTGFHHGPNRAIVATLLLFVVAATLI